MSGSECVRVVAEEILKGRILGLSDPLSYSGIAIVPIVRLNDSNHLQKRLSVTSVMDTLPKVILGSLPSNTCGIFILDSLGDVLAFKLHQEVNTFWERIGFVEKLVVDLFKVTRKPLSKISASSIVVAFLMRLKLKGPKGIMNSESDYFAISRTDLSQDEESNDLFTTTAAVLYCAAM
ncbi:MAG: hypothetical protein RTU63_08435 [Candidatus Thorarchaeota archaeon]